MEEKKESQVSTHEYYASVDTPVEETPVPTVEEEQSYSLEDLHPEEPKEEKIVAPASSPEEEIQPDPTVIDGIKATIGDSSAINEPQVTTTNFSQNVLEPTPQPVVSTIPQPVPKIEHPQVANNQMKVNQPKVQDPNTVPNAKIFYLVFGVILLLVIVGLPLYSTLNNSLNPSTGVSEPIKEETGSKTSEENTETETQTTTIQNQSIAFDMDLTFDKGWVTNEKEINQKTGFLPTSLTGVIRCDLVQPVVTEGITTYASTYLYYENYKLVSAISVTKQQYPTEALYTETKDATLIYKTAGDKNDSLDVNIIQDDTALTVTNIMKYNLQYGHTTYIDELQKNLEFSAVFSTNIKTAIDQVIANDSNSGNTVCGAILTNDAGA